MTCKDCGGEFERANEHGRPPLRCLECAARANRYSSAAAVSRYRARQTDEERREQGRLNQAARRRRNPEAMRLYQAMRRHQGIAPGGSGVCPICARDVPKLVVDHDHACCPSKDRSCGKCFRGYICYSCNSMLGYAGDSLATLSAASSYLRATLNLR